MDARGPPPGIFILSGIAWKTHENKEPQ